MSTCALRRVVVREGVAVDDEDAALLQVANVRLERGGVHRHQHVHGIAGRENVARRKLDLETADSGERARRGANFGGIVGERSQIVSVERDCVGELASP